LPGLPRVRNILARGKNLQVQGKARRKKTDILKKGQGKLKEFNTTDLIPLIEGWKKHLGPP